MDADVAALEARFHPSIDAVAAADWDALRPDGNPFLSHAFLALLEQSGCIREEWGWRPYHLGLYRDDQLVAAAPLYLKGNSHGEFVFDWSWASAFERAGGDYYPKLLNAVPYSPVPGPRLLAGVGPQAAVLRKALVTVMRDTAEQLGLSSVHANFLREDDCSAFDGQWLGRGDFQFHWHNRGYTDFEAFLAALNHKKRKNIRQERSQVARGGLHLEWCAGSRLDLAEWPRIHRLYEATFDAKGNHAALTREFFEGLATSLGDTVQLALARDGSGQIVAMAFFLRDDDALYGRYWGALPESAGSHSGSDGHAADGAFQSQHGPLNSLHFELCYYQGIEYCISQGLTRFEPGAQGGETKMPRGFLPMPTRSRHYIVHEGFRDAVRRSLAHEPAHMDARFAEMMDHSPYAKR